MFLPLALPKLLEDLLKDLLTVTLIDPFALIVLCGLFCAVDRLDYVRFGWAGL